MWRSGSPGASCLRILGSFSVYKGFSEVDLHLPTSILKPKHDPPMYFFFFFSGGSVLRSGCPIPGFLVLGWGFRFRMERVEIVGL